MLLKLRHDYQEEQGGKFSLRTFHDTLLGKGTRRSRRCTAQLHARSRATGGRPARVIAEYQCRSTNTSATRAVTASSRSRSSRIRRSTTCPKCGGAVQKLLSSPAIQFKGSGWYITDYAQERERRRDGGNVGVEDKNESERGSTAENKTDDERPSIEGATRRSTRTAEAERASTAVARPAPASSSSDSQVLAERAGQVRAPQREVDHRLQEPELVAGVVADAVDLARVDRPRLQQLAQPVGQLDLARAVALRSRAARRRCRASGCSGR